MAWNVLAGGIIEFGGPQFLKFIHLSQGDRDIIGGFLLTSLTTVCSSPLCLVGASIDRAQMWVQIVQPAAHCPPFLKSNTDIPFSHSVCKEEKLEQVTVSQ